MNSGEGGMRIDASGWRTRITDQMIEMYTRSGHWRNLTVWSRAREHLATDADRIVVVDGQRKISFGRMVGEARRLSSAFAKRGLRPGDVISFQLPNWAETMALNLAAAQLGLVCNPIVPIYRDAEVRHILCDARAKLFFVPTSFRGFDYVGMASRLRGDLPDLQDVMVVRGAAAECMNYDQLVAAGDESLDLASNTDPNAVKLLMYTSGTTGVAKGVLHTHNTIMAEIDAVIEYWRIRSNDVVLMPSPVTHITGYLYALEIAFAAEAKVVFMERWSADEAVDLIRSHGVTFSVGATPFLKELVSVAEQRGEGLPSLRLFISGGAPVPPEVIYHANRVLVGCSAFRVYGSTEAPTVT
ncbi:MAG: AMP-binding protein, partial [Pseudomonadota bacterium]|nr:AMP-binding protein [Pseudomonadota bacterium]